MANERAREGTIFVCGASGKSARWRYGWDDKQKHDPETSPGWDSSCVSGATLCLESSIVRQGSRVIKATAAGVIQAIHVDVRLTTVLTGSTDTPQHRPETAVR